MSEREMVKQCHCVRTTASGPRLVTGTPKPNEHGWSIPVFFVEMACDQCDTPWSSRPATAGEDG